MIRPVGLLDLGVIACVAIGICVCTAVFCPELPHRPAVALDAVALEGLWGRIELRMVLIIRLHLTEHSRPWLKCFVVIVQPRAYRIQESLASAFVCEGANNERRDTADAQHSVHISGITREWGTPVRGSDGYDAHEIDPGCQRGILGKIAVHHSAITVTDEYDSSRQRTVPQGLAKLRGLSFVGLSPIEFRLEGRGTRKISVQPLIHSVPRRGLAEEAMLHH